MTISTSGIIPKIEAMSEELKTGLAISFHAPNDEIRTKIMPINKKYPVADLLKATAKYGEVTNQRITFEYVMLDQVNDQNSHAEELIELVKNLPIKFNLIPFNTWPGCEFKRTPMKRIQKFAEILKEAGIEAPIRRSRGEDILAACGQLKSVFSGQ